MTVLLVVAGIVVYLAIGVTVVRILAKRSPFFFEEPVSTGGIVLIWPAPIVLMVMVVPLALLGRLVLGRPKPPPP